MKANKEGYWVVSKTEERTFTVSAGKRMACCYRDGSCEPNTLQKMRTAYNRCRGFEGKVKFACYE